MPWNNIREFLDDMLAVVLFCFMVWLCFAGMFLIVDVVSQ